MSSEFERMRSDNQTKESLFSITHFINPQDHSKLVKRILDRYIEETYLRDRKVGVILSDTGGTTGKTAVAIH